MSQALTVSAPRFPAMQADAIDKVRRLEEQMLKMPQVEIQTEHLIHAGMYARTIHIPAGVALTGVLIKLATTLVVSGHCTVFIGDDSLELIGHQVIPASAGRKQVFLAHADTSLTMLFPSSAKSVAEAEAEFTDEADRLLSRRQDAESITITGE